MIAQEIIARKRDGAALPETDIADFVKGLIDGRVSDAQAAAFAMAVFFRDLDDFECAALSRAMTRSGRVIDWRADELPGPIVDKHSTGGVGDLVSLILAPMAAACGLYVPMIAGRGLGHTGGTVDKLSSIPGYQITPSEEVFRQVTKRVGCAIIGQTQELAPADRRLYAIRDVTATVESIPLIVASILSKKLAAGLQGLVLDVKTGSGAFMKTLDRSRTLALRLAGVASESGLPTTCLITDMSEPLAPVAGNALEVHYAIKILTRSVCDTRVEDLCSALVAEMLLLGGLAEDRDAARAHACAALNSGAAADSFARMTHALGGPADLLEHPLNYLQQATDILDVFAERTGYVANVDAGVLGMAVVALGGGRTCPDQPIDVSVGVDAILRVGSPVKQGERLARIHARTRADAEAAGWAIRAAMRVKEAPPEPSALVIESIGVDQSRIFP